MESFESFLLRKIVRKVTPNKERIRKLIRDGEKRIIDINSLDINKLPKLVFENMYDAIRDFIFSILLSDGFNTSSHEAPIAYLSKKGFDVYVIDRLDKFRYKRNGSKYYGEEVSVEEAKDIKTFYLEIKDKLHKILNNIKTQNGHRED